MSIVKLMNIINKLTLHNQFFFNIMINLGILHKNSRHLLIKFNSKWLFYFIPEYNTDYTKEIKQKQWTIKKLLKQLKGKKNINIIFNETIVIALL